MVDAFNGFAGSASIIAFLNRINSASLSVLYLLNISIDLLSTINFALPIAIPELATIPLSVLICFNP